MGEDIMTIIFLVAVALLLFEVIIFLYKCFNIFCDDLRDFWLPKPRYKTDEESFSEIESKRIKDIQMRYYRRHDCDDL